MPVSPTPGLARFNAAGESEATAFLEEICTSAAWAGELLARRPYRDVAALLAASDEAVARLDEAGLAQALAGHPPIGRPRPGDPASAREQSGMAGASEALRSEMLELNLAYQEKFGQVFLICASGLGGERLRDALRERLGNSPENERVVTRAELAKINRLRLAGLLARGSVSTHVLDTAAGRPAAGIEVQLEAAGGEKDPWTVLGEARTDADGRCTDLPAMPAGSTRARLVFDAGAHFPGTGFFPQITVVFAVEAGEHYHVPLLLSPFGYSVYRGS
ncbi:2-oxo-4-hydroxy-4-carboxy-5-ureidoimidazoline decarboxylase [Streptomyces orinoci]|uniref:2-oxo-4-hydroxy-4-carboxy-5-ureidoimidazoline decarboxylase n=1 Tax=Streptomyces orinoci TaxID=67339 RepID=A0ABV3JZH9_STRON|nr:2-oxo-4-hydroxy-4-carboxy-5-ureidoimidazoline decarboxylase [Streptomyces orinoci]